MLSSFWPPPGRTPAVTWYWLLHSQNKVIVNTRLRPGSMMSWVGTFGKISAKIGNNSPVILDRPLTNWQRLQWSLPTVAAAAWNQLSCLVMRRCVEICGHRSVLSVLRIKYRSCEPNIVLWRLILTQKCDVIKIINFRCWLQIKQSDVSDSKSKLGYWLNYIQSQKRQVFDWRLKIAVAATYSCPIWCSALLPLRLLPVRYEAYLNQVATVIVATARIATAWRSYRTRSAYAYAYSYWVGCVRWTRTRDAPIVQWLSGVGYISS